MAVDSFGIDIGRYGLPGQTHGVQPSSFEPIDEAGFPGAFATRTEVALSGRMHRIVLALAFAMPLAGCATRYYYQPAEQATATVSGNPAARYVIPPDTRLGDVRVASFGIDDLQMTEDADPVPALHTRLVVSNERGQRNWTVDTRNISVHFAGTNRRLSPALAHADGEGMPVVTIPRGESRTIDTYHFLPADIEDAEDLPQFDVVWQVQTDTQVVSERTPFERREIEPPRTTAIYPSWGIGPFGWYDPWYPRPIIIQRITPRPRVYYYPR